MFAKELEDLSKKMYETNTLLSDLAFLDDVPVLLSLVDASTHFTKHAATTRQELYVFTPTHLIRWSSSHPEKHDAAENTKLETRVRILSLDRIQDVRVRKNFDADNTLIYVAVHLILESTARTISKNVEENGEGFIESIPDLNVISLVRAAPAPLSERQDLAALPGKLLQMFLKERFK